VRLSPFPFHLSPRLLLSCLPFCAHLSSHCPFPSEFPLRNHFPSLLPSLPFPFVFLLFFPPALPLDHIHAFNWELYFAHALQEKNKTGMHTYIYTLTHKQEWAGNFFCLRTNTDRTIRRTMRS
jgi:hypothetical protein